MPINKIFEEYYRTKDQTEITIEQMKSDLGDMINRIVLYGAGSAGIAFLYYLRDVGIQPLYFADGNPSKWGTVCEELQVIDYREITEKAGSDALVIVTINTDGKKYCKSFDEALRAGGHQGVHKNLKNAGCRNVIDYTYFRRCRKLFQGDKYNLPSCSDVYMMEQHMEDLCEAYSLLEDDKSREVYEKLVRFRMIDDSIHIPTEMQDKQYFEYEFYPKRRDEIFVDCGAYNGISLMTFLEENNEQFRKYYGIEPDIDNYEKLKNYILTLPNDIQSKIQIVNKAAYDEEKKLRLYSLNGPGSFVADIGNKEIESIKIDSLVDENGATFIKMNIEGSELSALNGAERTIEKYKPRLAIAGYHKTWDLWEVPLTINKFCPSYKFYLRSYMNNVSFVYYGI
jgi:FkbM family methyltransferase